MKQRLRILGKKLQKLTRLKEAPEAIALGSAVGIFWNFIPSVGIGPFLSLFMAKFLKGSGVAAVSFNLATGIFIPLYYSLNLITGRFLTGGRVTRDEIEGQLEQSVGESVSNIDSIIETPSNFFLLDRLQDVTVDFILGALVNATLAAIIIYFLFLFILRNQKKFRIKKKVK